MASDLPRLQKPLLARLRTWWTRYHLPVLFAAGVLVTFLGMAGFRACPKAGAVENWSGLFYRSLQLFGLESGAIEPPIPWQLQWARFLAPLITISALLTGLARIFQKEIRELRCSLRSGHTVVCGLGRRSNCLLRREIAAGNPVVVIERNASNRFLPFCDEFGIHVIDGNAADPDILQAARVDRARRLLICTGRDNENLEITATATGIVSERNGDGEDPVEMYIHLVDRQTRELFRKQEVFTQTIQHIRLHVFDVYENAARSLWQNHLLPAPATGEEDQPLHVIVVGIGQMGAAILCEGLQHSATGRLNELRLSAIDLQAERIARRFTLETSATDPVDWTESDLDDPETIGLIRNMATEDGFNPVIVLCMDNDYTNVTHALRLARHLADPSIPIFIRLAEAKGLAAALDAELSESALAKQIGTFGLLQECVVSDDPENGLP